MFGYRLTNNCVDISSEEGKITVKKSRNESQEVLYGYLAELSIPCGNVYFALKL